MPTKVMKPRPRLAHPTVPVVTTAVPRRYLTVQAAAELSGMSVWFWRDACYAGACESTKPFGRAKGRLLIPEDEVMRVLSEGTRPRRRTA
jgi:hypothetical protein